LRRRRRRYRDATKGVEGERYRGGGVPIPIPSPSDYIPGSMGEHPKLPQWGRSPGQKWILCVLSSTKHISDRQKRQIDQMHFDQLLELQRMLTLNPDKFGTGFVIRDNSACRMASYFFRDRPSKFGTVPKNAGRMVTLT